MTKKPVKSEQNPKVSKQNPDSKKWQFILALFIFTFFLYANTLNHGFVLDDALAIELNDNVTSGISGIKDIVFGAYRENNLGGQLYRPVSLILFAIEWQILPKSPNIHHFFNVFWYAMSVIMVFLVLSQWFGKNKLFPLIAALFFAAHPLHTEVVANIKSRDEIMCLFFILTSIWCWNRHLVVGSFKALIGAIFCYFFALISKESGVTMFPIFALIVWCFYNTNVKKSILKACLFLIPVLILFVIRHALFGHSPMPSVDIMDNPIVSVSSSTERFFTSMTILWKYFTLLVFPSPLSSDYSYIVLPIVGLNSLTAWLSLSLHIGLLIIAAYHIRKNRILTLFILGYFMAISLFSQLPMIIGTMFGERLAYLASFWWLSGFVYLIFFILKLPVSKDIADFKSSSKILMASAVLIVFYTFLTMQRNFDWKDNFTLFVQDAQTYPQSVRLNNGAAEEMLRATEKEGFDASKTDEYLDKAEKYCKKILDIKPVATAYLTLGNIRFKQKKYNEALEYYDQVNDLAAIVDANKALAYRELGREAGEKEQNIEKSQNLLKSSLKLNENDAETWYLMGVSYGVQGQHQNAANHFEKAFALSKNKSYANSVITAYKNLGNQQKVDEYQKYLSQ